VLIADERLSMRLSAVLARSLRRPLKVAFTGSALVALALAGFVLAGGWEVALTDDGPDPATVSAALGDTVTFVNEGSLTYTIVASRSGLTPPPLAPDASLEYVLTHAGRIAYRQRGPDARFRGEILVKRVGEVTLALRDRRASVRFGAQVALVGRTSLPAFPVVIQSKQAGERRWNDLVTATPTPNRRFSVTVRPPKTTQYRASVLSGELLSQPVAVDVMPILTMRAAKRAVPAGTRIVFTVRVSPGYAAKSVTLMRYDRDRGRWERETTRTLRNGKAAIVWPVRQGRSSLRAWVKRGDLNPGFAESYSNQIRVTGVGETPG
jgi:hypothetical protein